MSEETFEPQKIMSGLEIPMSLSPHRLSGSETHDSSFSDSCNVSDRLESDSSKHVSSSDSD